jgi:prefoldin subunit 5
MSKKSFVERALIRLKGGSESHLLSYNTKTVRFYKDQIDLQERAVVKAQEKIAEKEEAITEYAETPDLDAIKTSDSRDAYIQEVAVKLNRDFNDIDQLEKEIETAQKQIAKYKKLISVFE